MSPHLSAALLLLKAAGIELLDPIALVIFFAIAGDYEKFGSSFRAHSRSEFLLNRDEGWSIRSASKCSSSKSPIVPRIHADDLAILREYRPWQVGKRQH